MKISVVMALYNGERYLLPQLESIRNQSRQPDEVLLSDDGSADLTYSIAEMYIKEHKLDSWKLRRNAGNLGWMRNFYELLRSAEGDIVFFSDQDDVWDSHKIEKMASILEKQPEVEALACCYDMVFEQLEKKWKGFRALYKPYGCKRVEQVRMGKWWLNSLRFGSTLAVREPVKSIFLNIWREGIPHDGLLEAIGISRGGFYVLNEKLVSHRMHGNNNTPLYKHTKEEQTKVLQYQYEMGYAVLSGEPGTSAKNRECMEKQLKFLRKRIDVIRDGDFIGLIGLLRFIGFYPRYRSWIGDAVSILK